MRQSRGNLKIPTAFEVLAFWSVGISLSTENIELDSHSNRHAFEVHSGRSCILVGTFQLHSSRIRAAIEGQSKIPTAFEVHSSWIL